MMFHVSLLGMYSSSIWDTVEDVGVMNCHWSLELPHYEMQVSGQVLQ